MLTVQNRTSEEAEVEITGSGLGDLCSIVVLIDAGEIRKCKRCLPRLAPEDTEVQLGKVLETEMK